MSRLRNMENEILQEELNKKRAIIEQAKRAGLSNKWANFAKTEASFILAELARRWRNQAVAKNRVRKNRKVQERVRMAANAFKERARLLKPATKTSPAGLTAAAAYGAHEPNVTYTEMQRRMREMLRARRVPTRNASTSMSPRRRSAPGSPKRRRNSTPKSPRSRSASRSPNAKTRRT